MTQPRCTQAPTGAAAAAAEAMRAPVPRIETARLVLRAPEITDLQVWTTGYLAEFAEPGETAEDAWYQFSVYSACWMLHGHGLWTIERQSDQSVVGFVMLGLEWTDQEPELGYLIAEGYRRKGYAEEACRAVRDHGIKLLDAGGFVSYVDPDNAASNGLAAKLGAARDARAEARIGDGSFVWRHGASS